MHGPVGGREDRADRLPHGRRPPHAPVRGEPRGDRDASAPLTVRGCPAPGLPVLRSGPVPAVHVRRRAQRGPAHRGTAGAARHDGVPEDERRDRPADLRPARAGRVHVHGGPCVRRRLRPSHQGRRPGQSDHGLARRRPRREDLHRPQHESAGGEHRRRVFAAARSPRAGLDPAHLGRGPSGRVRAAGLPDRQRVGAVRDRRRPVGGRP